MRSPCAGIGEGIARLLAAEDVGEGTNVQRKLVALHHLDVPWQPADIEQREGRIVRQGDQNEFVRIDRYVAAPSARCMTGVRGRMLVTV